MKINLSILGIQVSVKTVVRGMEPYSVSPPSVNVAVIYQGDIALSEASENYRLLLARMALQPSDVPSISEIFLGKGFKDLEDDEFFKSMESAKRQADKHEEELN